MGELDLGSLNHVFSNLKNVLAQFGVEPNLLVGRAKIEKLRYSLNLVSKLKAEIQNREIANACKMKRVKFKSGLVYTSLMGLVYQSGDLNVHVVPNHYKVSLTLRPAIAVGTVEIDLDIQTGFSASCIPIHADEAVGITSASLMYESNPSKEYELQDLTCDSYMQIQTLYFSKDESVVLPHGKAKLRVEFTSPIRNQKTAYGIYGIYLGDEFGFATQFEPVGAREAFPCFDEPAIRTTFQLELTVPKGKSALSNTTSISKVENKDSDTYLFKPTIQMSAYLLCFAVGPFCPNSRQIQVNDGKEERELNITVWSSPAEKNDMLQALDWACNAVTYFTRTFACHLPLEKLDLVTLPLGGLGMENFGILTFRTGYLAISESTTVALRKRICLLILHEVSHLWFGDLVTVRWWSYLYLKEGFARLLEYTVATVLYPEHNWWDHFLVNHYHKSRKLDMDPKRTHPVEVPITRAKSSEDIFDFISYAKGASVLRMSSDMLGATTFFGSLPSLINTHLYQSIETTDLWQCFKDNSGLDVDIMAKWVKHSGHPTLTFSVTPTPENGLGIDVSQSLHILTPVGALDATTIDNICVDENGQVCYPIPLLEVKIFTKDGQTTTINRSLLKNQDSFTINIPQSDVSVILLNGSHRGYFAVEYSDEQWEAIHAQLGLFSPTELLGLLIELDQSSRPNAALSTSLRLHAKSLDNIDINTYLST